MSGLAQWGNSFRDLETTVSPTSRRASGTLTKRDVKNEDSSRDVFEKTGDKISISPHTRDVSENRQLN
jgi:hypothetical protein